MYFLWYSSVPDTFPRSVSILLLQRSPDSFMSRSRSSMCQKASASAITSFMYSRLFIVEKTGQGTTFSPSVPFSALGGLVKAKVSHTRVVLSHQRLTPPLPCLISSFSPDTAYILRSSNKMKLLYYKQ